MTKVDTVGFVMLLFIALTLIVMGGLAYSAQTTHLVHSTVKSVQPDTQITYNIVTFKMSNGDSTSRTVSCTGNFQFQVGQNVSFVRITYWWIFGHYYVLSQGLPAGCAE